MPLRKPIPENAVLHVFNKSIANYNIFNTDADHQRYLWMMQYFSLPNQMESFSNFLRDNSHKMSEKIAALVTDNPPEVKIIAYCLMPTHFHLVTQQKNQRAISDFMLKLQNGYTQYFNDKHNRKGPLWEGRFKHVECESDEQLIHLTRYVHLNPVTAYLVEKPDEWRASSYQEYLGNSETKICHFRSVLQIDLRTYEKFVLDRVHDQRMLATIKKQLLD